MIFLIDTNTIEKYFYHMRKKYLFTSLIFINMLFSGCMINNIYKVHNHTAIDPVCGHPVLLNTDNPSFYTCKYCGRHYYFDSRQCQDRFIKDPQRFLYKENDETIENISYLLGGVIIIPLVIFMLIGGL